MSQGNPASTCEYECINGVYTLRGGTAPPGYTCATTMGACNTPGNVIRMPPVPIQVPPPGGGGLRTTEESGLDGKLSAYENAAVYSYQIGAGTLYFSSGQADDGYGFFPSMTLVQLREYYPSIAEELSALQTLRSLAAVQITIPALPAEVFALQGQ
jgi:hypothetical protein